MKERERMIVEDSIRIKNNVLNLDEYKITSYIPEETKKPTKQSKEHIINETRLLNELMKY